MFAAPLVRPKKKSLHFQDSHSFCTEMPGEQIQMWRLWLQFRGAESFFTS
jgi:hypothetical protein